MSRRKLDKPTAAMKDAAWRTLHATVVDPDSPTYAKVSAARAIIGDDPDEAAAEKAPEEPGSFIILPDNGRDGGRGIGVHRNPHNRGGIIIYDGATEGGVAQLEGWLAEIEAEHAAAHPVALPAPEKPAPLTPAERQRRRRERLRVERAAKPENISSANP